MTPTMEDVAGWLRDLSSWFGEMSRLSQMDCTIDLNMSRSKMWADRAAQIEAMGTPKTCDTCESYREYYEQVANYMRMTNTCAYGYAINQGPKFGCIHHKNMPQPPVSP